MIRKPRKPLTEAQRVIHQKSRQKDDDSTFGEPWPCPIEWHIPIGGDAARARRFWELRPGKIISSHDILYALDPDTGLYSEKSDKEMAAEIRATDKNDRLEVRNIDAMVKGIHLLTMTTAEPFTWIKLPKHGAPDPLDTILFRNGILDIRMGDLIPYDGSYFATATPDFDYQPRAKYPRFEQFLKEVLEPSYHWALQEWFGYCMTADTSAHKIGAFLGIPRSGKSTMVKVLEGLVGNQHYIGTTLGDFGGDFGLWTALGKKLIMVPDAKSVHPRTRSTVQERIKSISGEDVVSINRKNLSPVHMRLPAKINITANEWPSFIEESGALALRLLVFEFQNSFAKNPDTKLAEKLCAELPGIANWAIGGLKRLREDGFTVGKEGRAAADRIAVKESPARYFAEECLQITGNPDDFTPMAMRRNDPFTFEEQSERFIFSRYDAFADAQGYKRTEKRNQLQLRTDLETHYGKRIKYTQRRVKEPGQKRGVRRKGFAGVLLVREDSESESEFA